MEIFNIKGNQLGQIIDGTAGLSVNVACKCGGSINVFMSSKKTTCKKCDKCKEWPEVSVLEELSNSISLSLSCDAILK